MDTILLAFHSIFRWLVLAIMSYAIYRAYRGWLTARPFSPFDNRIRHLTATIIQVQLLIGLWLYFASNTVSYFLHHFHEAIHNKEMRFFGMEHSLLMLITVIIVSIGSASAKRKPTDREKFRTMAIWFTIGFLIILIYIPWAFSPMASRPWFRPF